MRYKRMRTARRKAFSAVEILLALAVVGILFGLIFAFYKASIEKAKYVEAVATVDSISKAEEINQMNTGEYVAADNTQEVNDKLGLDIESKTYNYKVIDVTNDNFIVLAEKILDDINSGNLSSEPTVIARNKSGPVSPNQPGESTPGVPPGESSPATTPSGSGTPGGGGPSTGSPTEQTPPPSNPAGGGGNTNVIFPQTAAVSPNIINLLNDNGGPGQAGYNIITAHGIKVVYADPADFGEPSNTDGWWPGPKEQSFFVNGKPTEEYGNVIYINKKLATTYSPAAIAAIIDHEATHADYTYNGQTWITYTQGERDYNGNFIHVSPSSNYNNSDKTNPYYPFDSIDQEYNAFLAESKFWAANKDSVNPDLDWDMNNILPANAVTEAAFKADLLDPAQFGGGYSKMFLF